MRACAHTCATITQTRVDRLYIPWIYVEARVWYVCKRADQCNGVDIGDYGYEYTVWVCMCEERAWPFRHFGNERRSVRLGMVGDFGMYIAFGVQAST